MLVALEVAPLTLEEITLLLSAIRLSLDVSATSISRQIFRVKAVMRERFKM